MTRCQYLTARCPFGCEVWLHPLAVPPHERRCPGHRWTERRPQVAQVLLVDEDAERARILCPPEVVHQPTFSEDRMLSPPPAMRLRDEVVRGVLVESPLEGITGRRWWTAVRAATEQGWALDAALDADMFEALEQRLGLADHLVRCDVCGDDLTRRGLANHKRTNSVCRFLSDTAEVRTFWDLGYRDPFSVREQGVPITWTELNSRVAWRNRIHVVHFRLWTAVLIRFQ